MQRWDAARRRPVGDPLPHPGPIQTVPFRPPDGRAFLSARRNTVRLFSTTTGKPLSRSLLDEKTLQEHRRRLKELGK